MKQKLFIGGCNYGECNAHRQYGEIGIDGHRDGWAFAMANGIEIRVPFYMIKSFTSFESDLMLVLFDIEH